ncbi:MAG: AsnC family protein [Gammaproteobacteria bacterium]|nr:AsnC family protein [Gammaproteobacteria bacterium]
MALKEKEPYRSECDASDLALLHAVENGLPLVPRPFAALGEQLGMPEGEVMARFWMLQKSGTIKRFGVVVRHHELGYRANAMVVWDIDDEQVAGLGRCLGGFSFVTLCYRRPRRLPEWPYNLFTMIHGRDRVQVLERVDELVAACDLADVPHEVLFSRRRFKQRGARYGAPAKPVLENEARGLRAE